MYFSALLTTVLIIIVPFFFLYFFRKEDKSNSCYFILAGHESLRERFLTLDTISHLHINKAAALTSKEVVGIDKTFTESSVVFSQLFTHPCLYWDENQHLRCYLVGWKFLRRRRVRIRGKKKFSLCASR